MYSSKGQKNTFVFILVLLAGIVIGGFIGQGAENIASNIEVLSFLKWLNYGKPIGIKTPVTLFLGIIDVTFGFIINFNVCGVIGMIVAIFLYRKL